MIGTDLNQKAQASAPKSFELLPEGRYTVRVKEIKPWKQSKKDIKVNIRDENGQVVKDENGKAVTELKKDYIFYGAQMTFEIINDKEYNGRLLFPSLTTHPNASFITENFLYAVNISEIPYAEIQNKCKGLILDVDVIINNDAFKVVQDPVSGAEKRIPNPRNEVKSFKRTEFVQEEEPTVEGL